MSNRIQIAFWTVVMWLMGLSAKLFCRFADAYTCIAIKIATLKDTEDE